MNLIRLLSGCFAAAFMVGCSTVSVSEPEKATDAYTDLCDPAACKMSNDGLPATTNGVLRAWLEADPATVQEKMYNAMRKVLTEGEIHYVEDVTNHTLKATILADGLFRHVDVTVVVGAHCVRCYHALPILVAPELRGEVAKLLVELNSNFTLGSFEMDCLGSGKVSFRHMLHFETIKYGGDKRIGELLLCGMTTIKNHEKRLWAVCGGLKSFDDVWEEDWDAGQSDPK